MKVVFTSPADLRRHRQSPRFQVVSPIMRLFAAMESGMTFTTPQTGFMGRAGLPAGMLDGVRRRRIIAVMLDFLLVSTLVGVLWLVLLVLTLGLAWFILPPLFPAIAFFYNGLTVAGPNMATPGMRALGLQIRMDANGARVPFINAALQGVLFYVSWCFPAVLLVSLVTEDKRCLHDILSGVIVVRAS